MPKTNLLLIVPLALAATPASAAPSPQGIWLNDTGRGAVEIKQCGGALCGHVVWLRDASDAKGCGKQIIGEAADAGGGRYDGGWIYSPEKRQRYNVELTAMNDGRLKVVGYAGLRFLSKTMIWTKAPADLVRCDAPVTTAAAKPADAAPAAVSATAPPVTSASAASPDKPAAHAGSDSATAEPTPPPRIVVKPLTPPPSASTAKAPAPATDEANASETAGDSGEAPSTRGKAEKLADLLQGVDLDKIIKKSNGKCKLNTPWFKVELDCE